MSKPKHVTPTQDSFLNLANDSSGSQLVNEDSGIHNKSKNNGKRNMNSLSSNEQDLKKTWTQGAGKLNSKQDNLFGATSGEDYSENQPLVDHGIDIAVSKIKSEFTEYQKRIYSADNELQKIETQFYRLINAKAVELEGIGDNQEKEIERHRHLFEMNEIVKLERRMRALELEKIRILKIEMKATTGLKYESNVHGFVLDEMEEIYEVESRKRELTLTKLYQRLNQSIKRSITNAEGTLKVISRRHQPEGTKDEMLFDGIRDQKLKSNWIKTPQPVVVKLLVSRCMRDKIPKGDYIIRATVMDRLVENKMYYKFIEYGQRVNEQRRVDEAKLKQTETGESFSDLRRKMTDLMAQKNNDTGSEFNAVPANDDEAAEKTIAAPLFGSDSQEEDSAGEDDGEKTSPGKKVMWGTDVADHKAKTKKINKTGLFDVKNSVVSTNMNQTKIGFDSNQFDKIYKGKNVEKVWLDFGKINTNIIQYDPMEKKNIDYNGHKMYFMLPPSVELQPSQVILFELVYLSSKATTDDVIMGWGAFPIVNGDFEINTGKFKVPFLYGNVDFSTNKFKDVEQKYMRNIDEWLCNLYIEVKKIELFDFRDHSESIKFTIPKKILRLLEKQRKQSINALKKAAVGAEEDEESSSSTDSDKNFESSEEESDDDTFDLAVTPQDQQVVQLNHIDYHSYKYCESKQSNVGIPQGFKSNEEINSFRKVQFILFEITNDLGIQKGSLLDWFVTALIAFAVVWARMFIHYGGQYLILKAMDCPVTDIIIKWYKIELIYAYWNMYQELGVIVFGTFANTLIFCFFVVVCHISQKYIWCFPVRLCKVIGWYGLATCFDFVLIVIIDMANQDDKGDMFKLYNYYNKAENSGFIGLFLTILVELFLLLLNIFLFYNYIVFVHMDARISDIYLRITGLGKGYYIPLDNEISWTYLKQTYCLGEINNNRVVVNEIKIPDNFQKEKMLQAKSYQFQRFINEKSVATDDVYFANERGQIIDVDYQNMRLFRDTTLHHLIEETTNWTYRTPGLHGRGKQGAGGESWRNGLNRNSSRNSGGTNQDGRSRSQFEDGRGDDGGTPRRAGTINLVRNFLSSKIQKEQSRKLTQDQKISQSNVGRSKFRAGDNSDLGDGRSGKSGNRGDPNRSSQSLSRDDDESDDQADDWTNKRTGGPVIVEKLL